MAQKLTKVQRIFFIGIMAFVASCAPGPPPPPMFPGFEWLIIGLIVFVSIFLWKEISFKEPLKTNYLTEAINAINRQLKELEKKIDELGKKQDQSKDT